MQPAILHLRHREKNYGGPRRSTANYPLKLSQTRKRRYADTAGTNEPRHEKTGFFAYAKTKTQISFAVTAKLIGAFVFAT